MSTEDNQATARRVKSSMQQVIKLLKMMTWPGVILLIVLVFIAFSFLEPITRQTQIIELLKVVTWPAVVIFIVLVFRKALKERLSTATRFEFDLPVIGKIIITMEEAEAILKAMLKEVDDLVEAMTPEESDAFFRMDSKPAPVPAKFERGSPYHNIILRSLRTRHLIRPSEGGSWTREKHIEITPFGHLVLQIRREQIQKQASQAKVTPSLSKEQTP